MSIPSHPKLNICSLIERLLPAQPCILCGSMSHVGLWCEACDRAMPYLRSLLCPACAKPSPQGTLCGHCLQHPPAFNHTIAAFAYQFPLDKLIQAMKYQKQLALTQIFADKLLTRIGARPRPDYVIAMPLHPAKLRRRGYNQALLIAAPLARALDIPLLVNTCHRLRDTPSQSTLPWKNRQKNMRHAFCCDINLSGKHIALVDDVLTTGASMNELALAVKKCDAREISAWVVARSIKV